MRVIWKYPIPQDNAFGSPKAIKMPPDSLFLCTGVQYGQPCMWFLVADVPFIEYTDRYFVVVGTGQQDLNTIPSDYNTIYLGTFQLHGGTFVGHVFEVVQLGEPEDRTDVNFDD